MMKSDRHIVIHKEQLCIFGELSIPIPMSHAMDTKTEAMRWMMFRGMQAECTVMPAKRFVALGGTLPNHCRTEA
ncbi:MAG TPA: hypothetical protein VM532_12735, partial [Burkholderiales bacterium]|nr:hypothetical protein [Burkholderiales bacterium]